MQGRVLGMMRYAISLRLATSAMSNVSAAMSTPFCREDVVAFARVVASVIGGCSAITSLGLPADAKQVACTTVLPVGLARVHVRAQRAGVGTADGFADKEVMTSTDPSRQLEALHSRTLRRSIGTPPSCRRVPICGPGGNPSRRTIRQERPTAQD